VTIVIICDANVLYPSTLRDVLIRLAQTGLNVPAAHTR
jgi:hypothetical protein